MSDHDHIRTIEHPLMLQQFRQSRSETLYYVLLYAGAIIAALLISLVPIYLIVRLGGAWQSALETVTRPRTIAVISNSLLLTIAVTASTTAIALPLAWLTTRTDLPGRTVWALLAALPLVIPSYIYAYLFLSFLSPKGILQQWLEPLVGIERLPPVYGFWGAFIVLTLIAYPYTFLTVRAALQQFDPALEEAAQSLGLSRRYVFLRVTLPNLRPALAAGGLLVSLYCLRDFGAVTLMQYSTFTRVIYNRYQGFRLDEAASLALILVAITSVILALESYSRGRAQYARVSGGAARLARLIELGRWKWLALLFTSAILLVSLLMPLGVLLYWVVRGLRQDVAAGIVGESQANTTTLLALLEPATNSIFAALLAAIFAMLLALPIAFLAVRQSNRLTRFFERLSYASFALPGIVVALAYVYIGINFARPLYQTLPMLLAAYIVLFLPQAVGAARSSVLQIKPSLEEAGRSLGRRPLSVFQRITLPLVRPGLTTGGLLVFLTVMKELPATLILSPLGFYTLSTAVWANISEAFFARAAIPTLLLLVISSVPLAWLTLRE
jgi:iron(III) transport system permease protein